MSSGALLQCMSPHMARTYRADLVNFSVCFRSASDGVGRVRCSRFGLLMTHSSPGPRVRMPVQLSTVTLTGIRTRVGEL